MGKAGCGLTQKNQTSWVFSGPCIGKGKRSNKEEGSGVKKKVLEVEERKAHTDTQTHATVFNAGSDMVCVDSLALLDTTS